MPNAHVLSRRDGLTGPSPRAALAARWFSLLVIPILSAMAYVSYTSIHILDRDAKALIRQEEIISELDGLQGSMTDFETGTRGYLIAENPQFLIPAQSAVPLVAAHLRALRTMLVASPSTRSLLPQLESLARRRVALSQELVGLVREGRVAEARRSFGNGLEKGLHDRFRRDVLEIRRGEQDNERALQSRLQEIVPRTIGLIIGFFAIIGIASLMAIRARTSAARAEARYRSVSEVSPDLILVLKGRRIIFVNPAGEALLKAERKHILGRTADELFDPAGEFMANGLPELEREPSVLVNINREELRASDGSVFQADLVASSFREHGGMAVLVKCRDVTERLRLERQLQQASRLEALGQLTGGIAHDFNNLLTVIIGSAEFLGRKLDEAVSPQLHEASELITRSSTQAAVLVSQLLAFARRQPLAPEVIDVHSLIDEIGPLLRRVLREDLELRTSTEPGGCLALVDAVQLESALVNLAINARDAMPNGGCLTIEAAEVLMDASAASFQDVKPGRYVKISVTDTGAGMPPEVVDRAFDPFFTTKNPNEGTGLGLSMVYGFVRQSGGFAKIYSELGIGTVINLFLPAADQGAEARPRTAQAAPDPAGRGESVLFVEDNSLVRAHVTAQLTNLGYQVTAVESGAEAIDALRGARFDLLFTDVVLSGGMSGQEIAERARSIHENLPVLFTSGYTENGVMQGGLLDPGVRMLAKPFRRYDLARAVRDALGA